MSYQPVEATLEVRLGRHHRRIRARRRESYRGGVTQRLADEGAEGEGFEPSTEENPQ